MNIYINGEHHELLSSKLIDLIEKNNFKTPFAIAVNKTFIPKYSYATTQLQDGDHIDVVSPIQGG